MIPLVEARNVSKRFVRELDYAEKLARMLGANLEAQAVHAVDRVDLRIMPGEVVGLVGESGCGKSTLGRIMAGIMPPSDGEILWQGQDRRTLAPAAGRAARLGAQMIFQDPMSSLNPRKRVIDIIGEAPVAHGIVTRREKDVVCGGHDAAGRPGPVLSRPRIRTSSPAARGSGSGLRGRSRSSRNSSSAMNRSRRSTSRSRRRSSICSWNSSAISA